MDVPYGNSNLRVWKITYRKGDGKMDKKKMSLDNLNTADRRLVISAIVSLVSFFLPWIIMRGFLNSTNLGVMLMSPFVSRASGLPLGLVVLAPISAIVMLILYMPKLQGSYEQNQKLPKNQIIIQFVMIVIGFLPFILIPIEIKTWSGGDVNTSIGLWIAILAQIGMLFFSIQGITER